MYIAQLTFLDGTQSGRTTPPRSGFHPHILIDDIHTSCKVISCNDGVTVFNFGIEHAVLLELMFPQEYGGLLRKNDEINLFEGSKKIAEGRITDLIEIQPTQLQG